jgi:hypothetical protein
MDFAKFEHREPSHQNAVDIFKDHWASNVDAIAAGVVAGYALHFCPAPMIAFTARVLGKYGRLDGMSVLELGPLEGGKTYGLEQLGADVLAIEANAEGYLKCLIAKEMAHMKSRFMLGNFIPYLENTTDRFDIVFASGVLYHMQDPISVIHSLSRVTSKVFVYAAVYEPDRPVHMPFTPKRDDRYPHLELFVNDYRDSHGAPTFWGGIAPNSTWMTKAGMLEVFNGAGFKTIVDEPQPPVDSNGVVQFCAMK